MENSTKEADALIPKAEIFAEAERRNLAPSDDRFDRFRVAGLLGDLVAIPGTTQRGFTPQQAQRFFDLLQLCKGLGTKKPRASALAFWLCWHGANDVPPELVCEHIERTVVSYLNFLKRQFDRRRVPPKGIRDADRWRKAGLPWAKAVIKNLLRPSFDNGLALDFLSTMIGLALQALISRVMFDAVAGVLKRIAFLVGVKDFDIEVARRFWNLASEGVQLFTLDERQNPMVTAIRQINAADPSAIIGITHDSRRALAAMGAVFPIYDLATAPVAPDPADENSVFLYQRFPPAMCAITALTRDHDNAKRMSQMLREGNVEPILAEFYQIKVVTDSVIGQMRKEHP
jgi:hypothetical protein